MRRVHEKADIQMRCFGGIILAAVAATVLSSSCYPNTETVLCEGSDLRCPPGFSCSIDQGVCIPAACGNNVLDVGEQCDDGNLSSDDECLSNCMRATCGDGQTLLEGEAAKVEECDDGNAVTEECMYGTRECMVCNRMCRMAPGVLSFCGDGMVQILNEVCDDGNPDCGTCSESCGVFKFAYAIGSIAVVAADQIQDGHILMMNDGFRFSNIFEFNKDDDPGNVGPGHLEVRLESHYSVNDVRKAVIAAINKSSLLIEAFETGPGVNVVALRHVRPTGLGNQRIMATVPGFIVTGMHQGAGADCLYGESCRSDVDCVSLICRADGICGCLSDADCASNKCDVVAGRCL